MPRRAKIGRRSSEPNGATAMRAPEAARMPVPQAFAPSADALATFNSAMMALQRHKYGAASDGFRAILQDFPNERGLRDRSQVYLDLCDRELRRVQTAPLTLEEQLTAATAALNDDDEDRAEALARSVLRESPQQDLAMYLIAAVAARRGDRMVALEWLNKAVASNPELRAQVRHDEDFSVLREIDAFRQLLEKSVEPARSARRVRSER
jgi:hypothetical protein